MEKYCRKQREESAAAYPSNCQCKVPGALTMRKGGKPFLKEHFHSYPCLQQQNRGDSILCHGGLCSRMLGLILYLCITCVFLGFHEVLEEAKGQIKP